MMHLLGGQGITTIKEELGCVFQGMRSFQHSEEERQKKPAPPSSCPETFLCPEVELKELPHLGVIKQGTESTK